jgi:hypothetical protein
MRGKCAVPVGGQSIPRAKFYIKRKGKFLFRLLKLEVWLHG